MEAEGGRGKEAGLAWVETRGDLSCHSLDVTLWMIVSVCLKQGLLLAWDLLS